MAGKEGERSFLEKANTINKGIDLATVGLGILAAITPIVFFGIMGFLTGDIIGRELKKHK